MILRTAFHWGQPSAWTRTSGVIGQNDRVCPILEKRAVVRSKMHATRPVRRKSTTKAAKTNALHVRFRGIGVQALLDCVKRLEVRVSGSQHSHPNSSRPDSGMRQRAHLLRVDDLLVLAAFLRAFGTFERIDLLPAGEVDRLDTAGGQQTVDGFRIAVSGHATAFGALDRSSSMLVTMSSASDLVEPIRPTGPRLAQPVAYRRSRTCAPSPEASW